MKNVFFSLLATIFLGISCKKSHPPAPVVAIAPYMSLSSGNTWNYELINNIAPATSNFTLTASNKDTTVNSRIYRVFTNSSGSINEYYNITGKDYFNFRSLPSAFGATNVEINYLNDQAIVGTTWIQTAPVTINGIPFNVTLTNTITEKGITKVVKGISYTNVIHVTTVITVTFNGIPLPASALTTDIQTFYAEKYGSIFSVNKIDLNYLGIVDKTDQQTSLISADIK